MGMSNLKFGVQIVGAIAIASLMPFLVFRLVSLFPGIGPDAQQYIGIALLIGSYMLPSCGVISDTKGSYDDQTLGTCGTAGEGDQGARTAGGCTGRHCRDEGGEAARCAGRYCGG